MGGGVSTPTVLAAASTSVGGSVGIAKQVSIGGTASSIRGVLCLSLLRYRSALGLGFRVENVTTDDRLTYVLLRTLLASQAGVATGRLEVAAGLDPVEVDVCRRKPGEHAERQDSGLHFGLEVTTTINNSVRP
jgi:hypothetical protein